MQKKFLKFIFKKFKISLSKLLTLSVFQTLCEVFSLFILVSYLIFLFTPGDQSHYFKNIPNFEGSKLIFFENNLSLTLIFLGLVFILKNIIVIFIIWLKNDICGRIYRDISGEVYQSIIDKDIEFFSNYSSGNFLQSIQGETEFFKEVLLSYISIVTEILTILSLFFILFIFQDFTAVIILTLLIIGSGSYSFFLKKYNNILGERRKINAISIVNHLLGTLSLLKLIKLKNKNKFYLDKLARYITNLFKINRNQTVIQQSSHNWLEILLTVVVIGSILMILNDSSQKDINVPELLLVVLITLRFFPSFSSIISSVTTINYGKVAITNTLNNIETFVPNSNLFSNGNLVFDKIELNSLGFKYNTSNQYVLKDLNRSFRFPSLIGIKGSNGSGKSTLINILIGLLKPSLGTITIDGNNLHERKDILFSWKMGIGYVDQKNYFTNDNVKKVVAFGHDDKTIDKQKVYYCLKKVGLDKTFKNLDISIGESGGKISGGQLQRLNIARALYDEPSVFVFDENY